MWPFLQSQVPLYDGFLVTCYSHHPLVGMLKAEISRLDRQGTPALSSGEKRGRKKKKKKYATGILEASVSTCLNLLAEDETFGIVSTGKVWELGLTVAVNNFLGLHVSEEQEPTTTTTTSTSTFRSTRFSSCSTTGLNATELHDLPASQVRQKMKDATKTLLRNGDDKVGAICLGCAGMAGLDGAVREACVEELGEERGGMVRIVDGVMAGVAMLVACSRGAF